MTKPAITRAAKAVSTNRRGLSTPLIFLGIVGISILMVLSTISSIPSNTIYHDAHPFSDVSLWQGIRELKNIRGFNGTAIFGNKDSAENQVQYHMVFSTSCSEFQDWQSYVFFYFAWLVGQRGTVTRIASGCNEEQAENQKKIFQERIRVLSEDFHLHLTPDFSGSDKVKYFNKPFGLLHWMENVLGYPETASIYDNDIIMILDPDMMLLKPLTHIFDDNVIWSRPRIDNSTVVRHGHPFAQMYGFGSAWLTSIMSNISFVVNDTSSKVLTLTRSAADSFYPAGPPYLATTHDMYRIAKTWVGFLPRVHQVFPEFMAEMHAYSTAAAHLNLPHHLAISFMISDIGMDDSEGWQFLDQTSRADACEGSIDTPLPPNAPYVFHYCQRYAVGRWFFGKYKLPEDFFSCSSPLLRVPPRDVATRYNWWIYPNNIESKNYTEKPSRQHEIIQNAWTMCRMIDALNSVSLHLKMFHCTDDANYNKTLIFHDSDKFKDFILHGSYHGFNQ